MTVMPAIVGRAPGSPEAAAMCLFGVYVAWQSLFTYARYEEFNPIYLPSGQTATSMMASIAQSMPRVKPGKTSGPVAGPRGGPPDAGSKAFEVSVEHCWWSGWQHHRFSQQQYPQADRTLLCHIAANTEELRGIGIVHNTSPRDLITIEDGCTVRWRSACRSRREAARKERHRKKCRRACSQAALTMRVDRPAGFQPIREAPTKRLMEMRALEEDDSVPATEHYPSVSLPQNPATNALSAQSGIVIPPVAIGTEDEHGHERRKHTACSASPPLNATAFPSSSDYVANTTSHPPNPTAAHPACTICAAVCPVGCPQRHISVKLHHAELHRQHAVYTHSFGPDQSKLAYSSANPLRTEPDATTDRTSPSVCGRISASTVCEAIFNDANRIVAHSKCLIYVPWRFLIEWAADPSSSSPINFLPVQTDGSNDRMQFTTWHAVAPHDRQARTRATVLTLYPILLGQAKTTGDNKEVGDNVKEDSGNDARNNATQLDDEDSADTQDDVQDETQPFEYEEPSQNGVWATLYFRR
ncbi:hypothetical protein EJ03DRAFT_368223 [Teratosphaeria nubilosa]|uniref:Uncharacterized protein n=1 Tax=Teratosphaeria nubilosa TaxID=161662 RepID=A0A6G1L032_9PEZI|nr:hypothetical protein EJ03DRAFT_368223 [Teratosphaeria nubilosa]